MPSLPLAHQNLPSQTHELFLMGGKEDVGSAGPTILLRARDVTENTLERLPIFRSSWEQEARGVLANVIANNFGAKRQCPRRQLRYSMREENP